MKTLQGVKIKGFKSIENADLKLGDLNVVIGANGSGKSNLIGAFRLLERVLTHNLQLYVASEPDRFLFHGRKTTPALSLDFELEKYPYGFVLAPSQDSLIFIEERIGSKTIAAGNKESRFKEVVQDYRTMREPPVFLQVENFIVYHFHDTSDTSPAKQAADLDDNRFFRPNASNLPAYLYWLQEKHSAQFRRIEEHVRLVAPFFDRFVLAPSKLNEKKIKLEWRQKGSEAYFDAYSLSDGSLRFICLATLLLQPNPPALILLDEPELGLHPFALRILAEMLDAASERTQVLVATQSVTLLDNFPVEQIIVADHDGRGSRFRRLCSDDYAMWLENFSVGELWEKNVFGGRP
ncbi:MAG: AAA family ATPase [Candidatus Accumulibacter sp.]|nr:AAA family ATPase [Accumulibacter sp.]